MFPIFLCKYFEIVDDSEMCKGVLHFRVDARRVLVLPDCQVVSRC